MSSCTTGFHHWCDGCTCTCHTPSPKPATQHVALAASPDDDEKFWDEFFGLS